MWVGRLSLHAITRGQDYVWADNNMTIVGVCEIKHAINLHDVSNHEVSLQQTPDSIFHAERDTSTRLIRDSINISR